MSIILDITGHCLSLSTLLKSSIFSIAKYYAPHPQLDWMFCPSMLTLLNPLSTFRNTLLVILNITEHCPSFSTLLIFFKWFFSLALDYQANGKLCLFWCCCSDAILPASHTWNDGNNEALLMHHFLKEKNWLNAVTNIWLWLGCAIVLCSTEVSRFRKSDQKQTSDFMVTVSVLLT